MSRSNDLHLITDEEAMRLAGLERSPRKRAGREQLWDWPTVANAVAQVVTEEHIQALARRTTRRTRIPRRLPS